MKIAIIVGTRPQYIKLYPLLNELKKKCINFSVVNTGQHYDNSLSTIFFQDFKISDIKYNLNINSSFKFKIDDCIKELKQIIKNEGSDIVIVFGDCNTTLAGAIAAKEEKTFLIHIESGLRCGNDKMVEERNRVEVDMLSDFLFCPSDVAVRNLHQENIVNNVFNTGDIMYDLFLKNKNKFKIKTTDFPYGILTLHRMENLSYKNLELRFNQIRKIKDYKLFFPIHPNTKKIISKYNISIPSNILIIKPMGWFDLMSYIKGSNFVITDSGGLQKEAFWMRKPCVTIRQETEWIETIDLGVNILIQKEDSIKIPKFNLKFKNPYGDGNAACKMVQHIRNYNYD